MRRIIASLAILLLSTAGARAVDCAAMQKPDAQQHWIAVTSKAETLIDHTAEDWFDAIAAVNHARTSCTPDEAKATAEYDAAHATTFSRTLSFDWDATAERWVPAAAATADVRLVFEGPVVSGTATVGGHSHSFCRAEAPKLVVLFTKNPPQFGVGDSETPMRLVRVPPGFGDVGRPQAPYVSVAPVTPRAKIEARIAEARDLMERTAETLTAKKTLTANKADHGKATLCQPARPRDEAEGSTTGGAGDMTYYRRDTPGSPWMQASEGDAQVRQIMPTPVTSPSKVLDDAAQPRGLCETPPASKLTTSAIWQDEGENVLTFTATTPNEAPAPE